MPTKDEHIQKANDNEKFANALATSNQAMINWKLVILFYTAVHYVEAYLAPNNVHLRSHQARDGYITRESNLRKIRMEYNHLKFYGYNARYEADQFTAADVTDAIKYLAKVKGILQPLI